MTWDRVLVTLLRFGLAVVAFELGNEGDAELFWVEMGYLGGEGGEA